MAIAFMQNVAGRVPPSVLAAVGEHLRRVESCLHDETGSQVNMVETAGRNTLEAGGKRLRPALIAVSAHATGLRPDANRLAFVSASLEMIHMASLVHDDVIDGAATRRGHPTASATFGNHAAILCGDVLLAKSMLMLARDADLRVIRETSEAVVKTIEGQVREVEARGNFDLALDVHLSILQGKTAELLSCCCRVGAIIAGADDKTIDALGAYGLKVGMAFQIVDDLLDYRGDFRRTGKPWAADFREGCATWPLIDARGRLTSEQLVVAKSAFGAVEDEETMLAIYDALCRTGSYDYVARQVLEYVTHAKEDLACLPKSAHRHLLDAVADFVVDRDL